MRQIGYATLCLLLGSGCATAWGEAQDKNTAKSYQEYIYNNPDGAHVEEAKELEAKAALRELGNKPTEKQLRDYLATYPNSPVTEDAKEAIDRVHLERALERANLAKLKSLMEKSAFPAIKKQAAEGFEYFGLVRKGLLLLKPKAVDEYVEKYPNGRFTEDAKRTAAWIKQIKPHFQTTMDVVIDGKVSGDAKARVKDELEKIGVKAELTTKLSKAKAKVGELLYRVIAFQPSESKTMFDEDGKPQSVTVAGGIAMEVLQRTSASGFKSLWSFRPKDPGFEVSNLEFPAMSWPTTRTLMSIKRYPKPIGEMGWLGKYLVVAVPEGFDLYNTSVPDRPFSMGSYRRPEDKLTVSASAKRMHVRVSGHHVALYGEGLDLLNCAKLSAIQPHQLPSGMVGKILSGDFVGDHFYFVTKTGFYVHNEEWPASKPLQTANFSTIRASAGQLVTIEPDGFSVLDVLPGGKLGSSKYFDREDYPIGFTPGEIFGVWADPPGFLLGGKSGDVLQVKRGKLKARPDLPKLAGRIDDLDGRGKWLAVLGARGLTLLKREAGKFELMGSVPVPKNCHDIAVDYPVAYLACKDELRAYHVGALTQRVVMPPH